MHSRMRVKGLRRAVLTTVLAVLAVLALGLSIAQDQHTIQLESRVSMDDPRAFDYLAVLVGTAPTPENTYEVLTNGDQAYPAMLAAIDRAERRISFETFIYEDDEVGERFTQAFERAARRGVRVQMVIDAVGASAITRETVERLQASGVAIQRFNPTRWYTIEESNYRTHRKILVVDGRLAFTGGLGVAKHWAPPDAGGEEDGESEAGSFWRDTQVLIRGPAAERLEAAFYENFVESADRVTPDLDGEQPTTAVGTSGRATDEPGALTGPAIVVRGSSSGGSTDLKRLYLLALAMARRTVDIASPYFITDESVMWALEQAVRRGVAIRILVEGDRTDALSVKYASRHAYDRLLSLGIHIYEYQPTMMHAKVFVVDGTWSMFGSANFDNRSLELNDELNVAVSSPALAARFLADFERDLAVSRKLALEAWRRRPLADKVREYVWSFFGELF